jgi:hypothetical protein
MTPWLSKVLDGSRPRRFGGDGTVMKLGERTGSGKRSACWRMRKLDPSIWTTTAWGSKRSSKAVATTGSPKNVDVTPVSHLAVTRVQA